MLNIFTCFHVTNSVQFSWVAQSCPILQPHGLQHTMLPCPSPTPGSCSNSCPSSRWCHPTISSSVVPLLLPSVFPSIGVFSNELVLCLSSPKYWSFSFSLSHSMNIQDWFSLGWTGWVSLLSKGFLNHSSKASILWHSAFFMVQLSHPYMITGNTVA